MNKKEIQEDAVRKKVHEALTSLIIAFHKQGANRKVIVGELLDLVRNGVDGIANGSRVKNLGGWDIVAEFMHELKGAASEFSSQYREEVSSWTDINGLLVHLNENGFKIKDVRTIQRRNDDFEAANLLEIDHHYRKVNEKESQYHKTNYETLYKEHLRNLKRKVSKK